MIDYCVSELAFCIGEIAVTGMLYEVSTSPSPGLVSPCSNGIHKDMDFFTFLRSTSSISHAMALCAQVGIEHEDSILERIRGIGIRAEQHMLKQTGGVNTQRGILFAAGVVCAAAGRCAAKLGDSSQVDTTHQVDRQHLFDREKIAAECATIVKGIVDTELKTAAAKPVLSLTNGERAYLQHGVTGIRGELQGGLQSVLKAGLPAYEQAFGGGATLQDALAHALIALMAVVQDTVVINRAGIEGYQFMAQSAKAAMELGGMLTKEGRDCIAEMEQEFLRREISPGGAADLLAVTVMLHELEQMEYHSISFTN